MLPSLTSHMHINEAIPNDNLLKTDSIFKGIFDPGLIGIWIAGEDPRNTGGKVIRGKNPYELYGKLQWDMLTFSESKLLINNKIPNVWASEE